MNKKWKFVLVASLIGNLLIVYVAYKALDYRSHVNYFLDRYLYEASGFSGRSIYAEDNNRLRGLENSGKRVVFLGSQIAQGWNLPKYFGHWESVNRGISGQRIGGYLLRFRPDVIELGPKAVVIEVSSYNFRPENTIREIEDYIMSLTELAKIHRIVPILTTVVPVRRDFDAGLEVPYEVQDSLKQYNAWLKEYCGGNDLKLVDFFGALSDQDGYLRPEYSASQIQLSPAGYDTISIITNEALKEIVSFAGDK
jgi:lysophospholipase L1-like esterase